MGWLNVETIAASVNPMVEYKPAGTNIIALKQKKDQSFVLRRCFNRFPRHLSALSTNLAFDV